MRIHFQNHASAIAAVAAVRPAFGNEFLAPETGETVSSFTRFCEDAYIVNEHAFRIKEKAAFDKTSLTIPAIMMLFD